MHANHRCMQAHRVSWSRTLGTMHALCWAAESEVKPCKVKVVDSCMLEWSAATTLNDRPAGSELKLNGQ
eukprot:6186296-Pleurochrysis_carterae.AAC.5